MIAENENNKPTMKSRELDLFITNLCEAIDSQCYWLKSNNDTIKIRIAYALESLKNNIERARKDSINYSQTENRPATIQATYKEVGK